MASFELNGSHIDTRDTHPHLLSALRDELGVLSPKDGCSPSGQCGCCTVLINGKARVACQVSLEKAEGTTITTLEGLDPAEVDRMATAFAAYGALQCGFCTPGIVIRTKALVDKKGAQLMRGDAARHLGAHLCRCTGYVKILDAVEALANDDILVAELPGGVGSRGIKYEGCDLAVGRRPFIDDMMPPGLLHGAFKLADHARAEVITIDTTAAEAVEGVERVLTAADVPGELRVGLIHKDWPVFIPEGGRTSYLGDVMAMVVADDRETARRAAQLVRVSYTPLTPITDARAAVAHSEDAVWGLDGNVLSTSSYRRGDPETALTSSAHVVTETFQTQRVDHAFLEPESTLAMPTDDGGLYVYSGGQGIWDDRDDIARVLDVDTGRVTVELVSNGGAFGGKEDMSNQAQTALAAWLLQRPVKTTFSREESFLVHTKRHPIRLEYQAGCDADGTLKALHVRMVGDSGPYASVGMKVLERAAGHASGPYVIPNIDVEAIAARTNNSVCGAFRGFGANQAQFAMEGVLDRLAAAVGISGWEIRSRNVVTPGAVWGPGQIMDDGCLGARACLDAAKPAYDAAVASGKPVGIGLGLKNSGLGNGLKEVARAVVHKRSDGVVEVRHCWTEMGQGVHTVALQVAVEELGIGPASVEVLVDTTRELGAGQTTGSRGTLMGAGSVRDACRNALADGFRTGVDYEGEYRVDWTNSLSEGLEHPVIHSTFGYAAQVVVLNSESGDVESVLAAHDVGRAVNPLLCEGQVEGAVHMGLGYALSEGFPCDEQGLPINTTLRSLDIIRPKDMPPVETILVESPDPNSPYGVKGVGEIGLVPTAGAVAAALHDHDGQWRNELPMANTANRERAAETFRTMMLALASNQTTGLVCAHHHLYSALARGMPAPPRTPSGFLEILELVWWRLDCALDLDIIEWSAKLGALEALEAGTTCIIDHHESPEAIEGSLSVIADACAEVGVRVNTCYGVTDRHPGGFDPARGMTDAARRGLDECARFIRSGGRGMVGVHAAFTCADETLRAAAGLADDLGVGVHIHVAEGHADRGAATRLQGLTNRRWLLIHGVHLPDDHGLEGTIIHNPRSNMNNAVGYAAPTRFPNSVGLGTDGIGADMIDEFRVGYVRMREHDVRESPDPLWAMLEHNRELFPDARYDVVTWTHDPMDPWHLAFTTGVGPRHIEIDGETVMNDGELTQVDAAEIRAKAAEAATRLHRKLET